VGIRFRRSVSLGKGVRLNLSKSGLGVSVGGPGLRYSVNTSGRRTTTVGIPGTGVYNVKTEGGSRRSSARRTSNGPVEVQAVAAPGALPKPGWFASAAEKRYYAGIQAYVAGDDARALAAFEACIAADAGAISARLFAGMTAERLEPGNPKGTEHLEAVVASDEDLPDRLQQKYLPAGSVRLWLGVGVTDLIEAKVSFNSVGAALILAERYQEQGRLPEAIGLVAQLHAADAADPLIRLSLADLLYDDGDHEGVLEAVATATNDSDVGVAMLRLRGAAMLALGHHVGALEALRLALAKTAGRDPELLKAVRYDRARAYEAAGQRARARADLQKLYATAPDFRDVRERLAALA
jgi:tetratricopeptide (TPR) repeat protein